jgi:hypothetical protein
LRFGIGRTLEPRERRTIAAGAAIVAVAAVVVLGILPLVRRWSEREAVIAARRQQLARLDAIAGRDGELLDAARALDQRLDAGGARLVRARTAPLASAALQTVIREYAAASVVTVTRLDAAGTPVAREGGALAVPATLAAQGDIYGIADFLRRLQHGPWLLEITDLSLAPNPVLRGNVLQASISLAAPVALEP